MCVTSLADTSSSRVAADRATPGRWINIESALSQELKTVDGEIIFEPPCPLPPELFFYNYTLRVFSLYMAHCVARLEIILFFF